MTRFAASLALAVSICTGWALQAKALSISTEVERGFRFFKYNSDFELQRLAYKDFQNSHGGEKPTIAQLDELLANVHWWFNPVHARTAAWYGHSNAVRPIQLLADWRKADVGRPAGYLELSLKLKSMRMVDWEYSPARMGWASLLFPAHQSPSDLDPRKIDERLMSASAVAVCWDRARQSHTNCGSLDDYINPKSHAVFVRAIDADGGRILAGECSWEIDPASGARFEQPKDVAGAEVKARCSDQVLVTVPADKTVVVKLQTGSEQAESSVGVDDQLIVGLGDSFSSGEGNPDVPAKLAWTSDQQQDWAADGTAIVDEVTNGPIRKAPGDYFAAQWIDRSCHRSAYSHQLRTALQLALEGPSAVTFLDYACSGAQVNAGLFQPFQGPEFTSTKTALPPAQQAQLPLLLAELCETYDGGEVRSSAFSRADEMNAIASGRYRLGGVIADKAYRCANQPAGQGFRRPIDLLYVSIGGNDLGFSSWITAAITREGLNGAFLPILKEDDDSDCANHKSSCKETRDRWKIFGARLALLRNFVDHRLAFSARGVAPVLLFTYPLPVQDSNGELCPEGNSGMTVFAGRLGGPEPVKVCLTRNQKGLPTLETTIDFAESHLNKAITDLAQPDDGHGGTRAAWQAITAYKSKFDKRGFCASEVRKLSDETAPAEPFVGCKKAREVARLVAALSLHGPAIQETLHLPSGMPSPTGNWRPFDAVLDYLPYAHRTRLLRTMNEADFLVNDLSSLAQGNKASGVLSLKDTATFGAFHPTAEANAIIADDFLVSSREILSKPRQ
ncbi:MAG: hypothetical protein JOY90_09315 [Bradyrhizobium sp.]|uniref:hypothetical protein n=1 Tax=Bradyrhizobium sp. TaxID=376 RepID=UPI001D6A8D2B|nr:hypothetical protein [Bradyrhizobium sp.]MBV9560646.1 hypothetical protein [Bradyrhizobium sp.]